MDALLSLVRAINAILLSGPVLITLLMAGVGFTLFSGFSQYRSLTHGFALVSGRHNLADDGKGVLSHFQALAAALSATVGLGNIGGVAIAVALGGPGAVFWMWMVGIVGMAIKTIEVTLAMLYRDTSNPDNPHGGTMYVCREGLKSLSPKLAGVGAAAGALFAIALVLFGLTGGNMFGYPESTVDGVSSAGTRSFSRMWIFVVYAKSRQIQRMWVLRTPIRSDPLPEAHRA